MRSLMPTAAMLLILLGAVAGGCARRQPPVARPLPPPEAPSAVASLGAPPPPSRVEEPLPVPPEPISRDAITNRSLDDLNRDSPLRPVFFLVDSDDLQDNGRAVVMANAEVLRKNPTWVVTVEGHCDERGTAEYNLALGERRAAAVKTHLASLGIAPGRVRTVSYGKEFPSDPGHNEGAWARNRRAQFVITSK